MKRKNLFFIVFMMVVTTITYLNHFDNSFYFDDIHAIVENSQIRSIKNIPSFFKDGTTSSSLPQNQTYRPIATTSLAIDYWLGDGYDLFYFHVSSFILFLLQGVLLFFFVIKILDISFTNKYNFYIAGTISVWYMIHPVMAETINYITARSELQSTFFVLLAFVMYQYWPLSRKYHLYIVPIIIGSLAKPTALMFAPLFFCYILLFEEQTGFSQLFTKNSFNALKKIIPALIVSVMMYFFIISMTPSTYLTGSSSTFKYLISQPYVLFYYFWSVIFPFNLNADTDWMILENIWSLKLLVGILFISSMVWTVVHFSKKPKHYPIAFGIAWFFIALAPTSSLIPLAEIVNDHRMFFPYVGLIMSVGWAIWLGILHHKKELEIGNNTIITGLSVILLLYATGTIQRNIVWNTEESLWKDVTLKSPNNGRGLMSYGVHLMGKGNFEDAQDYFLKALQLAPQYHILHTNLGILNDALGNKIKAEEYFENAIKFNPTYYISWYSYGKFLTQNSRSEEAIVNLSKSLEIAPTHIETRLLLMQNYLRLQKWDELQSLATNSLEIDPKNEKIKQYLDASLDTLDSEINEVSVTNTYTANDYINLSLHHYNKGRYLKCIESAKKAINLQPNFAVAYNNICASYIILGEYDKALTACEKALALDPNLEIAKNNILDIKKRQEVN